MMIEEIIKNYLSDHLSVPIALTHPTDLPKTYIIFEKTSSTKLNHINSATIAFQSYAPSLYEAAKLNERLKKVIESMIELNSISGVHLNSDYNFTDTETKQFRYQAVFDINY